MLCICGEFKMLSYSHNLSYFKFSPLAIVAYLNKHAHVYIHVKRTKKKKNREFQYLLYTHNNPNKSCYIHIYIFDCTHKKHLK